MIVAGIQHDIVWEDPAANFHHLVPLVEHAVGEGARLVVLTETYSTGFTMKTEQTAEAPGGPSTQFLVDQAVAACAADRIARVNAAPRSGEWSRNKAGSISSSSMIRRTPSSSGTMSTRA